MKTTRLLLILPLTSAFHFSALAQNSPEFTVHEWGTFTTVSASDGRLLPGVERSEEGLPGFVHQHDFMHGAVSLPTKGWTPPLANVTVRMETPVIYFYTEKPFAATVDVEFKGGSISQWYPERSAGETPPPLRKSEDGSILVKESTIDFATPYKGSIQWKVDVIPAGEDESGQVFHYQETPSWLHPRQTDSALVRTASGETEKYLFYRGLGNFQPPVTFTASHSGGVTAVNHGDTATGAMLLFENKEGKARWQVIRPLDSGADSSVDTSGLTFQEKWRTGVYGEGVGLLVEAGLFRKEADAMIQTWWNSYFEREGLRVFWIVPSAFTDTTLPLNITPAPARTVRVMVGRTEILTPEFESRLIADFTAGAVPETKNPNPWTWDRFYPAYAQRVAQLQALTARHE